jgi:hypothetical protein
MRENLYLAIGRHKEKTGKTQGEIGLEAGMVESRLCYIVRGKIDPTQTEKEGLARVLGMQEEILFGDSKKIPIAAAK